MAQTDTLSVDSTSLAKVKKKDTSGHQLCLGVDVFHPVINMFLKDRSAYEFQADYYLHNEFYGAMEAGWGTSVANYTDLKYTTTNTFVRLGFNKAIFIRDRPSDWDMVFFGLRLGAAGVRRSGATFNISDSVWGGTPDSTVHPKSSFGAIWAELTMGMRMELVHGIFAGWNVRGKFMMNGKSFNDLSPLYIAGYGRGDKNSAFDFNVYVSYAIRWKRKSAAAAAHQIH